MSETLFISDLHLDPSRPEITALFLDFLQKRAAQADALFILGDLFEAFIGDDDADADPALAVAVSLNALQIPKYFMHGNRDFLLGEAYAERAGFLILDDPSELDLYGVATVLLHGDSMCTADVAYQRTRAQLRNPQWQATFLAESIEDRRAFAERARQQSRDYTGSASAEIMDVTQAAVHSMFERSGAKRMIHGHTHRPAIHALDAGRERIVLGDWYSQGSVLSVSAQGVELQTLAHPTC